MIIIDARQDSIAESYNVLKSTKIMTNINESPVAYTIVVELKGTVPPVSSLRVKKAQHLLTDGRLQACTSTGKISSNAS